MDAGTMMEKVGTPVLDEMAEVLRRRSQPGYWPKVRCRARGLRIVLTVLASTLTLEQAGWEHLNSARAAGQASIIAIFHGSQLIPLYLLRDRGLTPMASLSQDGDFITEILRSLGFGVARGSSSRGGARALLEMVKLVKGGTDVAFTVDGPRGPRHVCKPGIVLLAQKSQAPVVPLGIAYGREHRLGNWDRFRIPFPFTRGFYQIGEPFRVDPGLTADQGCRLIEERLHGVEARAAEELARMSVSRATGGPAHG